MTGKVHSKSKHVCSVDLETIKCTQTHINVKPDNDLFTKFRNKDYSCLPFIDLCLQSMYLVKIFEFAAITQVTFHW